MKKLINIFKYRTIICLLVLSATPLLWFYGRGDVLINGVDTNFPLDPWTWFQRRLFVWDSVSNAGRDFSSSTAGLFFHLIQVLPYKLGLSLRTVQTTSLIFWFALIILSAYVLARIIFSGRILIQLLFVVLYSFNVYLFNTWENIKVSNLALISALPLGMSLAILLQRNQLSWSKVALYSVLVGIILSGAGINPSYFVTFFFILSIYIFAEITVGFKLKNAIKSLRNFFFITFFIFLVNLFWILPTYNFAFQNISAVGSIYKIGFTNWIDSLSQNTSLLNVMRMQGAWDWYAFDGVTGLPLYIPYALNYFHRFPFVAFSFLLPSLVFITLLLWDRKHTSLYLAFGLMLTIGVFLDAGTYLPTGHIFRWFADHLPFFTLFRSPWYIFTPLVVLAIPGLVGLLFNRLYELAWQRSEWKLLRIAVFLAIGVLVIGNLLYSYPLVTGKIFRPGRDDSFYTQFPEYVFDAQEWLLNYDRGRIISYPDDEIEKFQWGYRGIESILGILTDKEVVYSPLNLPGSPTALLTKWFYQFIKKGQIEAASALASKLNVGLIFEKTDQTSLSPQLPGMIKRSPSHKFDKWTFYEFPTDTFLPKIYSPPSVFLGSPFHEAPKLLPVLQGKDLLVNPEDTVVEKVPNITKLSGYVVYAENSQERDFFDFNKGPSELAPRLSYKDLSYVSYSFQIHSDGIYQPVLERYLLEESGVDIGEGLTVQLDNKPIVWKTQGVSNSYVYFQSIQLSPGLHSISVPLSNRNLVAGGHFEEGSGFRSDGQGDFRILGEIDGRYLSILNKSKRDISAVLSVNAFDPMSIYFVQLNYKQIYGNNAAVLVTQHNKDTLIKTQVERLPNHPKWNNFNFYYEPVKTDSRMEILLVSPFVNDPLGTEVLYDELEVYRVFTNNLLFVKKNQGSLNPPEISFEKISPVLYKGTATGASFPHIVVFSENYSPEWEMTTSAANSLDSRIERLHFSGNTYANAWYIENAPEEYKFKIYYKPQRLYWTGWIISGLTIVTTFFFFIKRGKSEKTKI